MAVRGGVGVAERGRRKTVVGVVVSDKMEKTVVVAVERLVPHPLYGRRVRRTKRYKAHDEENSARVGDRVELMETRPLSREKRWRIVSILQRAE
jgi:small subunit ribosomal protein S17